MCKLLDKKKKVLVIVLCVVLFAVGVLAFVVNRVPQRIAVSWLNKHVDFPVKLLKKPDFNAADYIMLKGHGVRSYYDKKYATSEDGENERDATRRLRQGAIVYYSVTSYPDAMFGSEKITRIECSDPAYKLFGCAAGDDMQTFSQALENEGFKKGQFDRFKKCGIIIDLYKSLDDPSVVDYFVIWIPGSNYLGVKY